MAYEKYTNYEYEREMQRCADKLNLIEGELLDINQNIDRCEGSTTTCVIILAILVNMLIIAGIASIALGIKVF
jgi:hypothetical protein